MEPEQPAESEPEQVALAITKDALLRFFRKERPRGLFYLSQLEVLFEDRPLIQAKDPRRGKKGPFHWITAKAVSQLAAEGRIASEPPGPLIKGVPHGLRFFHAKAYRDFHTAAKRIQGLVARYSEGNFTHGLGHQLELLIDSALASARARFHIADVDVNKWKGRKWTQTEEDLDRIYVSSEGIEYGCEIKNTLPYIERGEFERKLEMCRVLGVRPLFVARMMPESYIDAVWKAGGYSLVLKNQFYPLGFQVLATEVRRTLELPVMCARAIPKEAIDLFLTWHETSLRK